MSVSDLYKKNFVEQLSMSTLAYVHLCRFNRILAALAVGMQQSGTCEISIFVAKSEIRHSTIGLMAICEKIN